MSRPQKQTVDYFPHVTKPGKTIFILEKRFGNDGYAFWFKLLEVLGATDGHVYDISGINEREYLWAYCNVTEEIGMDILKVCAGMDAIDKGLLEKSIIWSDNFVSNLTHLYSKRTSEIPKRPVSDTKTIVSTTGNPHSIVKYSKVKESIVENSIVKEDGKNEPIPFEEIIDDLNKQSGKNFRYKSSKNQKSIKARWNEGYRLDDFIKVNSHQCAKWLKDSKMSDYLRPETLYGPKFEGYLNSPPTNPQNMQTNSDEILDAIGGNDAE